MNAVTTALNSPGLFCGVLVVEDDYFPPGNDKWKAIPAAPMFGVERMLIIRSGTWLQVEPLMRQHRGLLESIGNDEARQLIRELTP